MNEAENAEPSRITSVPYDPRLKVHTAWDLGVADSTVIWFVQTVAAKRGSSTC
jgi:phage terminase large subunit